MEAIRWATLPIVGLCSLPAAAQDLSPRPVAPPPETGAEVPADQIEFSAATVEYDQNADVITASGDVRVAREGNRLRADRVIWNRRSGEVRAEGDVAITNPAGDTAYGDSVVLAEDLRDGAVANLLLVLDNGSRLAAESGNREGAVFTLSRAAYTPCAVVDANGCPREPSFKVTARRVVYDENRERIRFEGATVSLFGLPILPLPVLSQPTGSGGGPGLLVPDVRISRVNGFEVAQPYYFKLSPNRDLTITPHIYTSVLPALEGQYRALTEDGAYQLRGMLTYSGRESLSLDPTGQERDRLRGFVDASGRFQLDPNWSISGSIRRATDRTFLRRYDISRDDRLRSTINVERIDADSYFSLAGWAVQTLRVGESQGQTPIALPVVDYRRRINDPLLGGRVELQLNSLAIGRTDGQDTQRAFAGARWDLRRLTNWGQEVDFTLLGRVDAYHTDETLLTATIPYRGDEGWQARGIAAAAIDVRWPLVGAAFGGTQRITPRVQFAVTPPLRNDPIPNEDSRAFDLDDSNLFSLNRFPGYDRFEDGARVTYGVDYALTLPGVTVAANVGQSLRMSGDETIFPAGTGVDERFSDFVGRTEVRFRDFISLTHRYRLDKDDFELRRNEIDATIGTRRTYLVLGYLRLNRDIEEGYEDLSDREEVRAGGRVQVSRFWSVFGSAIVDLTNRSEDPLSIADGFQPIRSRLGFAYSDDCLELGLTWRRDYEDTGDARRGNSFLFRVALRNIGR
ncbi:LPS-assembly protein LptD [Sphingomonas jejuensis]|nr:LPS assembly protein LptD [Sphingomonas jejuensis]